MVQLLGFPGSRSLNRCAKCSGEMDVGALYHLEVELAISGVEENLAIRERPLSFMKLAWRRRQTFMAFMRHSS
jgi:hypothetical protein